MRFGFLSVSPEYFSTLKVAIARWRPFRDGDTRESSPVAVINQTFAKQYFQGPTPSAITSLLPIHHDMEGDRGRWFLISASAILRKI